MYARCIYTVLATLHMNPNLQLLLDLQIQSHAQTHTHTHTFIQTRAHLLGNESADEIRDEGL